LPSDEWEIAFSCEVDTKTLPTAEVPFVGIDPEIENFTLKAKADASCKSVSTTPKMQSGGSLIGGWNLSTLNTQPKHATIAAKWRKNQYRKDSIVAYIAGTRLTEIITRL